MLYPSIDSLLEKVHSKYLLVTVAAKRAREIQETKQYELDKYVSHKNVGKSLEEIKADKLMVVDEEEGINEELYVDELGVNQEDIANEDEL